MAVTFSVGGKTYKQKKNDDGSTTTTRLVPKSTSSGGSSGGSSQHKYTISSDRGKEIANNLPIGVSWTNDVDGSIWTKNNDGAVSVKYNGVVTPNAYQMTDKGTLGRQQVDAGLPAAVVQGTRDSRVDKALSTDGLRQYAYDDTYTYLTNYINNQKTNNWFNDYAQQNERPEEPSRDPRIDRELDKILNRDKFSYNVADDPLYQQYAEMYRREGDRAMRETLAEAAAGAGGMNTYAITAAQQANNYYNSQLNDRIPELYQLAYNMYLGDIERDVQNLGILQNMDNEQYNRYRNTLNDWYNDKNFAYGLYQDALAQSNYEREYNNNEAWKNREWDYNDLWRNKEWDYNDAWQNKEWDYNVDLKNKQLAEKEKEDARAEIKQLISLGINPGDSKYADLVEKSGWDDAVINAMLAQSGYFFNSGGSGGGGGSVAPYKKIYSPQSEETDSTPSTVNLMEQNRLDLGLPIMTNEAVLNQLMDAGAIYDDENNRATWAPGWNASNYKNKLKFGM